MGTYRSLCLRTCLQLCAQMCVFVRKVSVFVISQTGTFDLEAGPQGRPLSPQIQSLSDSERKRGRVAERRQRELGRDRKEN